MPIDGLDYLADLIGLIGDNPEGAQQIILRIQQLIVYRSFQTTVETFWEDDAEDGYQAISLPYRAANTPGTFQSDTEGSFIPPRNLSPEDVEHMLYSRITTEEMDSDIPRAQFRWPSITGIGGRLWSEISSQHHIHYFISLSDRSILHNDIESQGQMQRLMQILIAHPYLATVRVWVKIDQKDV